jgi:hypothetical protein
MDKKDYETSATEVLEHAASYLLEIGEEIFIEERVIRTVEVFEAIRFEQELINLIDRVRNTENEIVITTNSDSLPVIHGKVRFTSDRYLVISNTFGDYLINLAHIVLINEVDNRAVFRTEHFPIETTTMWIKNLIDQQLLVTIFLVGVRQLSGQITRFGHDHLDLVIDNPQDLMQRILIPLSAIQIIRSLNETSSKT